MNLKLFNAEDNFVVESMSIGDVNVEFVHNTMDNSNWFNQKTLAKMFGVSQDTISKRLRRYLKTYEQSNCFKEKRLKQCILLKTNLTTQKVKFYNFKGVSYLAHSLRTPEAFDMLEWIDSSLNTMFNVATGKTEFNNMEVLV